MISDALKPTAFSLTWGESVDPVVWRRRLMTLRPPARFAAARIVWWDFFSNRLWPERWPHLDDMLKHRDEITTEELVEALVAIGYPQRRAQLRTMPPKPRKPRRKQ